MNFDGKNKSVIAALIWKNVLIKWMSVL